MMAIRTSVGKHPPLNRVVEVCKSLVFMIESLLISLFRVDMMLKDVGTYGFEQIKKI
jgi:hypothetical protein